MIVGFDELQSMSGERTAAKVIAISETGPRFDGRIRRLLHTGWR